MHQLFFFPVIGQTQDARSHAIAHPIVQADLHVILHAHFVEQADILEGTGNARLVDLNGVHARGILAVDQDGAGGGLIHLGDQVEDRGLASAVGADQAGDLRTADDHVEVVYGLQAAEFHTQMPGVQHRTGAQIALGNDRVAGERNHGSAFSFSHCSASPFSSLLRRALTMASHCLERSPLVTSMTTISTIAYTSIR